MNAIAEIKRIEADLYRFIQNASEAPRLMRDYLGHHLGESHVPMDHYDETCGELHTEREKREELQEEAKSYHTVIEDIRDILRDFPAKKHSLAQVVTFITSAIIEADTDLMLDEDPILEAIEEIVEKESAKNLPECPVSIANSDSSAKPTPHSSLNFRQQIQTLSPQSEPQNTDHENQDHESSRPPVHHAPRRLPLVGIGHRAA